MAGSLPDPAQHTEAHGSDSVRKALPLAVDVSHLELELCSGKPGVWRLRPKLAPAAPCQASAAAEVRLHLAAAAAGGQHSFSVLTYNLY